MPKNKGPSPTPISSITHKDKRTNFPTEELLRRNGFTVIYFEQRTEFTYPSEMYLEKIKSKLLRKILASIWDIFNRVLPIGNKMIVYARKE